MIIFFTSLLTLLNRKFILLVALVGIILPVSGNLFSYDYYNYVNSIEKGYNDRWMPLQKLFASIAKSVSIDIFFSLNFACVCFLIYLVSKKVKFGNFFIFCFSVFPKGLIWTLFLPRQYLAASFLLMALSYSILYNKKINQLIMLIFSLLSHKSAIIMYPFFLGNIKKYTVLIVVFLAILFIYVFRFQIDELVSIYTMLIPEIANSGLSYLIICAPWFIYPLITKRGHSVYRILLFLYYLCVLVSFNVIFSLSLRFLYIALPFAIFSCYTYATKSKFLDKIFLTFIFPVYSLTLGVFFYLPFFDGLLKIRVIS